MVFAQSMQSGPVLHAVVPVLGKQRKRKILINKFKKIRQMPKETGLTGSDILSISTVPS